MDYVVYAYLQTVQDSAAGKVVEDLGGSTHRVPGNRAVPFALPAMPARYAPERGNWATAAYLASPASESPCTTALTHFARALGAAHAGHPAAAGDDLAELGRIAEELAPGDPYWPEQTVCSSPERWLVPRYATGEGCAGWPSAGPQRTGDEPCGRIARSTSAWIRRS